MHYKLGDYLPPTLQDQTIKPEVTSNYYPPLLTDYLPPLLGERGRGVKQSPPPNLPPRLADYLPPTLYSHNPHHKENTHIHDSGYRYSGEGTNDPWIPQPAGGKYYNKPVLYSSGGPTMVGQRIIGGMKSVLGNKDIPAFMDSQYKTYKEESQKKGVPSRSMSNSYKTHTDIVAEDYKQNTNSYIRNTKPFLSKSPGHKPLTTEYKVPEDSKNVYPRITRLRTNIVITRNPEEKESRLTDYDKHWSTVDILMGGPKYSLDQHLFDEFEELVTEGVGSKHGGPLMSNSNLPGGSNYQYKDEQIQYKQTGRDKQDPDTPQGNYKYIHYSSDI